MLLSSIPLSVRATGPTSFQVEEETFFFELKKRLLLETSYL